MGAIRKTLSITTLGIIPFRSKKEKLHRAETAAQLADLEVRKEHEARLDADRRVSAAERRAREAELRLLNETKKAAARRRPRRFGRNAPPTRTERMSKAVHDFVEQSEPVIEDAAKRGRRSARRAAKRASKEAKHAAAVANNEGKRFARRARIEATHAADVARVEGAKVVDDVRDRAHELSNR